MFTGIIESLSTITQIEKEKGNINLTLSNKFTSELKIDQSIAHNGVCLTVTDINHKNNEYKVTAIKETIDKTNIKHWKTNDLINFERCMKLNARVDGHMVQGHIDSTALCEKIKEVEGSWEFTFKIGKEFANLVVNKGSICINGTSLTVVSIENESLKVAIIPFTFNHTNFKTLKIGDYTNIEYDIIGKYLQKQLEMIK